MPKWLQAALYRVNIVNTRATGFLYCVTHTYFIIPFNTFLHFLHICIVFVLIASAYYITFLLLIVLIPCRRLGGFLTLPIKSPSKPYISRLGGVFASFWHFFHFLAFFRPFSPSLKNRLLSLYFKALRCFWPALLKMSFFLLK